MRVSCPLALSQTRSTSCILKATTRKTLTRTTYYSQTFKLSASRSFTKCFSLPLYKLQAYRSTITSRLLNILYEMLTKTKLERVRKIRKTFNKTIPKYTDLVVTLNIEVLKAFDERVIKAISSSVPNQYLASSARLTLAYLFHLVGSS